MSLRSLLTGFTPATIISSVMVTSASDPTVNEDSGDGYVIGMLWRNSTSGVIFRATDVTVGAAVWKPTTALVNGLIEHQISTATNAAASASFVEVGTVTLTPGTWDICAVAEMTLNGATLTVAGVATACIGTTTASSAGTTVGYDIVGAFNATAAQPPTIVIPRKTVTVTTNTAYYLNAKATYTAGTPKWQGVLSARRIF